MKIPTLSSIVILIIFIIVIKFDFDYKEIEPICYRKVFNQVNWKMINPILFALLMCSIVEIYNSFKDFKNNYLNAVLVAPVLLSFIYWFFNIILNLFI